ncbi:hypothetical protein AMTR_s00044p00160960 [Amborella trichopoda]|uniref:Secreted protein n=1 Tax=Amborella trichopoda TaxID=13333 RepID=U5D709_AMBTC|nr:hypothetical protein AMTR_s00044p00160960 [Amborella trichopoda]
MRCLLLSLLTSTVQMRCHQGLFAEASIASEEPFRVAYERIRVRKFLVERYKHKHSGELTLAQASDFGEEEEEEESNDGWAKLLREGVVALLCSYGGHGFPLQPFACLLWSRRRLPQHKHLVSLTSPLLSLLPSSSYYPLFDASTFARTTG